MLFFVTPVQKLNQVSVLRFTKFKKEQLGLEYRQAGSRIPLILFPCPLGMLIPYSTSP